ncbi:MAG TPA: hypothetical protein VF403_11090 [Kofleriaceae bacterium]
MKRALVLAMLIAIPAHADDAANKEAAERYFRAGSKAYSAQNFSAAAAEFDEAYKAMPLPEIAFSAAQAYRRLYRVDPKPEYVRRAVELYRIYLEQVKTGGRVGDAADSLGELERLNIKVAVGTPLGPIVEHTRLGVSVTIAGQASDTALHEVGDATGEVTKGLHASLDGKTIEPFALIDVDAREHVLAVTADGYLPVEKKAVAITGQSQLIELELRAKPATVAVHTEDGAHISIDGRVAPGTTLEVPAGKHLITITHRGREPFGKELVVQRGETLTLAASLRETGRRKAVPYVLIGAGLLAAGAITTSIFALARDSHASDLRDSLAKGNQPAKTADDYDHTVNSRDHFVTATWILGGAALAAGATGALLYLFDEPNAESLRVTPMVGPGGGGAVLSGHF